MTEILEAPPAPCVPQLPVLDEETRRVLATAKGIVAKGWCQGSATNDAETSYCVMGALVDAAGFNSVVELHDLLCRIANVSMTQHIGGLRPLARWNDAPGRTQAEVVALFDKALTGA